MKKLMIAAAALMVACAAYGQGQFVFNTRDIPFGNDVRFTMPDGSFATGSDLFVQVFAGPDNSQGTMVAVTGTTVPGPLPLNRTGNGAGYTQPFSDIYTVPGQAGGKTVFVGYQAYKGTSIAAAGANVSPFQIAGSTIVLTEPPTPPSELVLGAHSVVIGVPEPGTLALGLLGLGTLLAFRRRQ